MPTNRIEICLNYYKFINAKICKIKVRFSPNSMLSNLLHKAQVLHASSILDGLRVSRRGSLGVGGDDDDGVVPGSGDHGASLVQIVKAGVIAVAGLLLPLASKVVLSP